MFLFFTSLEINRFEAKLRRFPRYVEGGFRLPGVHITVEWHTIVVLVVLGGAAALLALFFQTPPGGALCPGHRTGSRSLCRSSGRARGPHALDGVGRGRRAGRHRRPAGRRQVQQPEPRPDQRDRFLIPAFTGAVLGGITSMVGAVAGGLILGVTVAAANQVNTSFSLGIPGAPQLATFAVLLLVLLFRPSGLFGKEA